MNEGLPPESVNDEAERVFSHAKTPGHALLLILPIRAELTRSHFKAASIAESGKRWKVLFVRRRFPLQFAPLGERISYRESAALIALCRMRGLNHSC
jgi:hypothetical protein